MAEADTTPAEWWIIEDDATDVTSSLYWGGRHGWTPDYLQAVRFCREDDARSQADTMAGRGSGNFRIMRCKWHE
jgi:hypothetical protein